MSQRGFIITNNPGENDNEVTCLRVDYVSAKTEFTVDEFPELALTSAITGSTKAVCNEKDEYDLNVGAVISLMRMCGKTAVDKAYEEVYGPRPASTVAKLKRAQLHILSLKKANKELVEANTDLYKKAVDCDKYRYALKQSNKALSEGTDALEELSDKYVKVVDALKKAEELDEHRIEDIKELKKRLNSMYGTKYYDTDNPPSTLKPSKRVKFWKDIKSGKIKHVVVRREDINDFLNYAEAWDIYWQNGAKVTAWNNWNEWRRYASIMFRIEDSDKPNSGRQVLSWLGYNKSRPECQVDFTNYIPHGTAKMFKRGKYNIKLDSEDVDGFTEWCRSWELIPKDEPLSMQLRWCPFPEYWCYYDKEKKRVIVSLTELNDGKPTYDWKDL